MSLFENSNFRVSSRELVVCDKVKEGLTCGELLCRLGCDYGFVLDSDTACPLCECRDPCQVRIHNKIFLISRS